MQKRALPHIWLLTDPRLGCGLAAAVRRLPFGSGIIFRHYELPEMQRYSLFKRLFAICRRRGHCLVLAADETTARRWKADGFHSRKGSKKAAPMIRTAPVHTINEIAEARRNGADLVLLSPVFSTASHPGARPLGPLQFRRLAKRCAPAKVVALGGMNARRAMMLCNPLGKTGIIYGWAAIDAFGK